MQGQEMKWERAKAHVTYFGFLAGSSALWVTVFIREHLLQDQKGQQTSYHPQTLHTIVSVRPIYPAYANKKRKKKEICLFLYKSKKKKNNNLKLNFTKLHLVLLLTKTSKKHLCNWRICLKLTEIQQVLILLKQNEIFLINKIHI